MSFSPRQADTTGEEWGARAAGVLWAAYLFVFPFHRVWNLPWLGTKLQPPELVFLGLAALAALRWWRGSARWRPSLCDAAAAAWLVANVAAVITPAGLRFAEGRPLVEALGAVSLVLLYVAVRLTATPLGLRRFGEWFGLSAAIAATLGLAGAALAWAGVQTRLATIVMTLVPYLEHAPRAQALTAGPQMLASILLLAVPLFAGSRLTSGWRRRDTLVLALLLAGLGATLSKTAICVAAALVVLWASAPAASGDRGGPRLGRRPWLAGAAWVSVALIFLGGTHVMVVRAGDVERWRAGQVVAGSPLASAAWRGEDWLLMPTTYVYNKRASLLAIEEAWPAGIGPAEQPRFAQRMQREGRLPGSMWMTTPHSSYLGPVAELGALGLVALSLLLVAGGAAIRRLLRNPGSSGWEAAAYAGAGAAFLIEATSTDLLNCRHYWWLFAIMAARAASIPAGRSRRASSRPAPHTSNRDGGALLVRGID